MAREVTPKPEEQRRRQALTVTWGGLGVNIFLATLKFICGYVGNSQAVIAAAVHTLSDCLTDVMLLIGIPFWTAPPDRAHPHGHRRIETVITAIVAAVLAAGAGIFVFRALTTLKERHDAPEWIAFVAALISVAGKEGLYRWTVAVGRRIKSSALIANAWEHRFDGFSSILVAVAVATARLGGPKWAFLDHVGAVIVAIFILRMAWHIGWPALSELVDTGASQAVQRQIRDIALATDGVEHVHAIRTRYAGSALLVDLHIMVDGSLTVSAGHHISEVVKQRLIKEGPDLLDAVVHLEPCDAKNKRTKILFLCTGNSCRSQMAEGWAWNLKAQTVRAYSAGIEPRGLDPRAVKVMAEAGVDISRQRSKHVNEFKGFDLDRVVTLCASASERCPAFPGGVKVVHVDFDDPEELAVGARTDEEALGHYRRVRDEIKEFVARLPDELSAL